MKKATKKMLSVVLAGLMLIGVLPFGYVSARTSLHLATYSFEETEETNWRDWTVVDENVDGGTWERASAINNHNVFHGGYAYISKVFRADQDNYLLSPEIDLPDFGSDSYDSLKISWEIALDDNKSKANDYTVYLYCGGGSPDKVEQLQQLIMVFSDDKLTNENGTNYWHRTAIVPIPDDVSDGFRLVFRHKNTQAEGAILLDYINVYACYSDVTQRLPVNGEGVEDSYYFWQCFNTDADWRNFQKYYDANKLKKQNTGEYCLISYSSTDSNPQNYAVSPNFLPANSDPHNHYQLDFYAGAYEKKMYAESFRVFLYTGTETLNSSNIVSELAAHGTNLCQKLLKTDYITLSSSDYKLYSVDLEGLITSKTKNAQIVFYHFLPQGKTAQSALLLDDICITAVHKHEWDNGTVTTAPTCTAKGIRTFTCPLCGDSYTEEVDATGHNYKADVIKPTCTEDGYTKHTCSRCGNTYTDAKTNKLGHIWDAGKVTKAASCTEEGVRTFTCTRDGSHTRTERIAANGHKYVAKVNAASCTKGGNTTYECSACGSSLVKNQTNARGHAFGEWTVTTAPTCLAKGKETRTCLHCNMAETRDVDALGHVFGEWIQTTAPACQVKGQEMRKCPRCNTTETRDVDALQHNYDESVIEPTCEDQGFTTYSCALCGDTYTDTFVDALGHDWGDWKDETETRHAAYCTKDSSHIKYEKHNFVLNTEITTHETEEDDGSYVYECSVCGRKKEETVPATGHTCSWVKTERTVAPTCTEQGYTEYVCSENEQHIKNDDFVEALGHDYTAVVTEPTCKTGGYTTHTCSRCSDKYVDSKTVATRHNYVSAVTTPATCKAAGVMTYTCACGAGYTKPIPQTEHNYVPIVTGPKCGAAGYTTYTCPDCGSSYKGSYTDALGHNWNAGAVTTAATCTNEGVKTYKCTSCSVTKTEPVPVNGHTYGATVTMSNCTTGGKTVYTCSVCNDKFTANETAALGHKYDAVVTAPTCTADGYTTNTCSRCGDTYTSGEINKLGHNFGAWTQTTEPTCLAKGKDTRSCSRCDATETRDVNALGHNYNAEMTMPTCTADGYTTYTCSRCGDSYKGDNNDAIGHRWNAGTVTKAATCTEDGVRTFVCQNDSSHTKTEVITKLGHNYRKETVAPTCEEKGYTLYVCQNDASHTYKDNYTDALNHKWDSGKVTKAATCTENGVKTFTCENDSSHTRTEVIYATGHSFGNWEQTKAPTADKEGEETRSCTACGAKETRKVAKLPAIKIKNYTSSRTVDYKTTITFTAVVTNPVDGAKVHWFIDGQNKGSGDTYTVKEATKDFTVQVKYMKDGKVLAESDTETVKVNSGFFAKLKAFFQGLFKKLPVVVQEYLGVEFIDKVL